MNDRACTCHPDDNPPRPCPQRYAYGECVVAAAERERCAEVVEEMLTKTPWKEQMWARGAIMIAARAIRRGRHLTNDELMNNLNRALAEEIEGKDIERYERETQ